MNRQGKRQFVNIVGFTMVGLAIFIFVFSQVFNFSITRTQRLVGWDDILMEAIYNGRPVAEIESILESRPELTVKPNYEGFYATHFAALQGRNDVLQLLYDYGATVDQRGGRLQATPLVSAIRQGHLETVLFLLEAGADPHARMTDGATPVDYAHTEGSQAVKNALLGKKRKKIPET